MIWIDEQIIIFITVVNYLFVQIYIKIYVIESQTVSTFSSNRRPSATTQHVQATTMLDQQMDL